MIKSILLLLIILFPILAQAQTVEEYLKDGVAKANKGDYSGAIQDYNKAIELNPNDSKAYLGRGTSKYNLNDYRGAIEDYKKAIEHNPNDAVSYQGMASAKAKLRDYRGAVTWSSKNGHFS